MTLIPAAEQLEGDTGTGEAAIVGPAAAAGSAAGGVGAVLWRHYYSLGPRRVEFQMARLRGQIHENRYMKHGLVRVTNPKGGGPAGCHPR